MGKKLIIKDADFSANGIETVVTELICDSITGYSEISAWDSATTSAVSIPTNINVSGRTITSVVLKRYSSATATKPVAIAKFNTQTSVYTVLATISAGTFNANPTTEVQFGTGVSFGQNELLMVGAQTLSEGGQYMYFAMTTGNSSADFGKYPLLSNGTLGSKNYNNALMCKVYAVAE